MAVVVEDYDDIDADGATASDRDAIARCLNNAGEDDLVAYVPRWLADEKDIDTVIAEPIEYSSEKAHLVEIHDRDVWLPKSVITRFVARERVGIPQRGLAEFAGGGQA